jgi:hypothetical protein
MKKAILALAIASGLALSACTTEQGALTGAGIGLGVAAVTAPDLGTTILLTGVGALAVRSTSISTRLVLLPEVSWPRNTDPVTLATRPGARKKGRPCASSRPNLPASWPHAVLS